MVNKFPATCDVCGCEIPINGGRVHRTRLGEVVRHLSCEDGVASVEEFRNAQGELIAIRNKNGRCEDAPCCGCCS